jgi:DNA invertase Pin-like site-specific DNA recombinase
MPLCRQVVEAVAVDHGVCVRPVPVRRIDLETGEAAIIDVPCGATLAAKCQPCAERAKRLRMAQCREGWHAETEPILEPDPPTPEQCWLVRVRADLEAARARLADAEAGTVDKQTGLTLDEVEELISEVEEELRRAGVRGSVKPERKRRRVRSTRRRQDAPDLPRRKVEPHTVGKVYAAPDGNRFRPSIFLTCTLDTYGRVNPDGTPVHPDTYDYRRAARDAIHFGKLIDRFVQNMRRVAGYDVQYFAAVEPQRRLAPHLHMAIRGTIPRALIRQVAAATYHQVWWPPCDERVYGFDRLPVWDEDSYTYVEPDAGEVLPTWDEALDALDADPDAEPAHVVRFGPQVHAEGVLSRSGDADRCIGYLAKYLTKSVATCHTADSDAQRAHVDRLADALRYEPCSERCPNWLLYGVQPQDAHDGQWPGSCKGKAHRREHLGYAGRRVLVSRRWSGKTLLVRQVLPYGLMDTPATATAIYDRVSLDTRQGRSVAEQEAANRAAAEHHGWTVVGRYVDPNVSASRFATRERADWPRLLRDLDAGKFDILILWETSRGDRKLAPWVAMLDTCRDRGVKIHVTSHERTYDLANHRDYKILCEDGITNANASEETSVRVRRSATAGALAGRPHGPVAYGYKRRYDPHSGALVGQEADPETAPVVAEIIRRVAGNDPVTMIAHDLTSRGIPSPKGGSWHRDVIRKVASNVAYIGLRSHHGELSDAIWPALIDEETFYSAKRVLSDPARKTTRPGRYKHLLSYLAKCGICHSGLAVLVNRYVCYGDGHCVSIKESWLDYYVSEIVLRRLARPDIYGQLTKVDDSAVIAARAEAARLRVRLTEARDLAVAGELPMASLAHVESKLAGQITAAERRAAELSVPLPLRDLVSPGADIRDRWDALRIPARREIIKTLLSVEVGKHPAPGRNTALARDRIKITWLR